MREGNGPAWVLIHSLVFKQSEKNWDCPPFRRKQAILVQCPAFRWDRRAIRVHGELDPW
jgi:hypothetical protein